MAQKSEDIGRGHAERLMGLLGEVLEDAGLKYKEIDQIVATSGPGSFTGIRVGLATARGLALGLGIEAIGINVLEAIAYQHNNSGSDSTTPILVAMDAKRSEIFMQLYSDTGEQLSEPMAVPNDQLADKIPGEPIRIAGSANHIIADAIADSNIHQSSEFYSDQSAANIEFVARLAAQPLSGPLYPTPLYLRSADAKPQNNFAVKRITS